VVAGDHEDTKARKNTKKNGLLEIRETTIALLRELRVLRVFVVAGYHERC